MFNVAVLLRNGEKNFKDGLTNPNDHFVDTLHLVRSLIKENTTYWNSTLTDTVNQTKAASTTTSSRNNMMHPMHQKMSGHWEKSFLTHHLILHEKNCWDFQCHQYFPCNQKHPPPWSTKWTSSNIQWELFNASNNRLIKRSIEQNIANTGLLYDDLQKLYTTFSERVPVGIFSNPSTTSTAKMPRVTRTKRTLAAIVKHFEEKNHEEWGKIPWNIISWRTMLNFSG